MSKKIICGISMGDPAGIGPEIILKALMKLSVLNLANFLIIGDAWTLKTAAPIHRFKAALPNVVDLNNVERRTFSYGKIKAEYGRASMEYLQTALNFLRTGTIDCLVTLPINKKSINLAGFNFPGHTEYIAEFFNIKDVAMILLNKKLRVALVTRHMPLKLVPGNLTEDKILKTIFLTDKGLKSLFGIKNPKLAVCGLNPHASDEGVLGDEERRIIAPAIKKAKSTGIKVSGPFAADTIFIKGQKPSESPSIRNVCMSKQTDKGITGYDAIVCMYHDQGLIPLKMSGRHEAVNITFGLPIVRTSPGHGTAFDIAGTNKANPGSLIEAIKLAVKCTSNLRKG